MHAMKTWGMADICVDKIRECMKDKINGEGTEKYRYQTLILTDSPC